MDVFEQALGGIAGGTVLDVATGEGGFIGILAKSLKRYTRIVGIDTSERAIETARSALPDPCIRFVQMDAARLGFSDQCFDTVNVSASLHHLAQIPPALAEMKRVLKPGGRLVVTEMHRDGHTEAQLTAAQIHGWAAEVDSALGTLHNRTLARQEIVDLVDALGLKHVLHCDHVDADSDPMDQALVSSVEGYIHRYLERAKGLSDQGALERRGEALRRRLRDVGIQREPVLIIVGERQ